MLGKMPKCPPEKMMQLRGGAFRLKQGLYEFNPVRGESDPEVVVSEFLVGVAERDFAEAVQIPAPRATELNLAIEEEVDTPVELTFLGARTLCDRLNQTMGSGEPCQDQARFG